MLTAARAGRLARLAERTRGTRLSRWLARRAWRILEQSGDRGDEAAIEAVWRSWLRVPDDARWESLCRWRDAAELTSAVLKIAVDPERAPSGRKAIGEFCLRRGIAPEGEIERSLFYMLTGQPEQHHAVDPGGSALAAAYRFAAGPTRAALQQAMADAGGLDLIRVVAARRDQAEPMTGTERRYLSQELARRQDWPALWRVALGFPLEEATAAARLLDHKWSPEDEQGRELLARLVSARPDRAARANREYSTVRIEIPDDNARVIGGSFSPDDRRLAVRVWHPSRKAHDVREFDLPNGEMLSRHDFRAASSVLHLGDRIVMEGESDSRRRGLYVCMGERWEELGLFPGACQLAPYGEGFVVLPYQAVVGRTQTSGERSLLFCDRQGRVRHTDVLHYIAAYPLAAECGLTAEAGTEWIAVYNNGMGYFYHPSGRRCRWISGLLNSVGACFIGDDKLAVLGTRYPGPEIQVLRMGGRLLRRRRLHFSQYERKLRPDVVAIPARDEIAILAYDGRVRYLSSKTLAEVDQRHGLAGATGWSLWSSGTGHAHALGGAGFVEIAYVTHPLTHLLGRAMSEMTPGDLAQLAGGLSLRGNRSAEWPALELLHACLKYRFGAEVQIGRVGASADPGAAAADDIALSETRDQRRARTRPVS